MRLADAGRLRRQRGVEADGCLADPASGPHDLANRLASTTSYSYNGDGNRLQATAGSQITKYLWDTSHALPQLALERDGGGSLLRRYLYGHRRISLTSGGATSYYHVDNLGSVANVTSSTGTAQWTSGYEPFGVTRTETQDDRVRR